MRLLNVNTFELHEFFEKQIPPYSILSHRWGKDEVSYQDFIHGRKTDGDGFKKIRKLCAIVRDRKLFYLSDSVTLEALEWAWIDTCCIDKASSSELSEAINSMYEWYSAATECLIYLADVPYNPAETSSQLLSALGQCEWFTRGWTLQELLAPKTKVLYSSQWQIIGHVTKDPGVAYSKGSYYYRPYFEDDDAEVDQRYFGNDLLTTISRITRVPERYLTHVTSVSDASVAERMRWASNRRTTRSEDMAYCLLGLFDVNMPLLYGEGHRAFLRLQEEILRRSHDQSIFTWSEDTFRQPTWDVGLLAPRVNCFQYANFDTLGEERPERPHSVTNLGLQIHFRMKKALVDRFDPYSVFDPCCVPYVVELVDVAPRFDRSGSPNDDPKVRLVLLQCLHDKKRMWYRSDASHLLMRGLIKSDELEILLQLEKQETQGLEIFAALDCRASDQCASCQRFDFTLRKTLISGNQRLFERLESIPAIRSWDASNEELHDAAAAILGSDGSVDKIPTHSPRTADSEPTRERRGYHM